MTTLPDVGGLSAYQPPDAGVGEQLRLAALLTVLGAGRGRADRMRHVTIRGNPRPWSRPRARILGGRIVSYTDAETLRDQERIAWQLRPLGSYDGPVILAVIAYRRTRQRVDVDNLAKQVLDAATKSQLWKDDSQVEALAAIRRYDPTDPRLVVAISPLTTDQETLDV